MVLQVFPFFLPISAQIKGFGLRRRARQIQTPFVPVRKVSTAPARTVRPVRSTRPVALALELSRCVSGLGKQPCGWKRRAGVLPEAEGMETPTWAGIFPPVSRKWDLVGWGVLTPGEARS